MLLLLFVSMFRSLRRRGWSGEDCADFSETREADDEDSDDGGVRCPGDDDDDDADNSIGCRSSSSERTTELTGEGFFRGDKIGDGARFVLGKTGGDV